MRTDEWTDAELDLLRRRREERVAVPLIAAELDRSVDATYLRARKIGTRVMDRKTWDEAETATLVRLNAEKLTIKQIAGELNRGESSVRWKLDELGIGGKRIAYWTEAEDAVLRRLGAGKILADVDFTAILVELTALGVAERTASTVEFRLKALKIVEIARPRWSREEVKALKVAAEADDIEGFAIRVGRPLVRVKAKAVEMGYIALSKQYTAEEDQKIRDGIAAGRDFDAIGSELDRSPRGVRLRAIELGVVTKRAPRTMDDAGKAEIIAAARSGMGVTEAAKALGRDTRSLKAVAAEAGVAFAVAKRPAPPVRKAKPKVDRPKPVVVPAVRVAKVERPRVAKPMPAPRKQETVVRVARPAKATVPPRPKAERKVLVHFSTGSRIMTPLPEMDMSAAVSRFLAEKGVTRAEALDPVGYLVTGLRRRGYSVVGEAGGWVIDGRVAVADQQQLADFARMRGVEVNAALLAAR